jgi:Kef-type K+ transport system membrane component KefB
MLQVIINLLTLKALSSPLEVYAGLGLVWLLMLAAGMASVMSRPWRLWKRMFWCVILVVLPVIGMTLYCLLSLTLADYSFLKVLGLNRKQAVRLAKKPSDRRVKSQP